MAHRLIEMVVPAGKKSVVDLFGCVFKRKDSLFAGLGGNGDNFIHRTSKIGFFGEHDFGNRSYSSAKVFN